MFDRPQNCSLLTKQTPGQEVRFDGEPELIFHNLSAGLGMLRTGPRQLWGAGPSATGEELPSIHPLTGMQMSEEAVELVDRMGLTGVTTDMFASDYVFLTVLNAWHFTSAAVAGGSKIGQAVRWLVEAGNVKRGRECELCSVRGPRIWFAVTCVIRADICPLLLGLQPGTVPGSIRLVSALWWGTRFRSTLKHSGLIGKEACWRHL